MKEKSNKFQCWLWLQCIIFSILIFNTLILLYILIRTQIKIYLNEGNEKFKIWNWGKIF